MEGSSHDKEFDALRSLYELSSDNQETNRSFDTVQELEEHLLENEPDIVALLKEQEKSNEQQVSLEAPKEVAAEPLEKQLPSVTKISESEIEQSSSSTVQKSRPALTATRKPIVKTVLTKFETNQYCGPLALLSRCVREKLKVKILIRSRTKIRSTLTCFVVAFDKHWNLAVVDVDERYYKKKSQFVMRRKHDQQSVQTCDDIANNLKYVSVPKNELNKFEKTNNYEVLQRHVSQLFIKGDNVVMIVLVRL